METSDQNQPYRRHAIGPGTLIFGLIVILTGLVLLLRNTGVIGYDVSHNIFSWGMLVVFIGVMNVIGRKRWWGIFLIIVGIFLIPDIFHHIFNESVNFWHVFWPAVIILFGLSMIFHRGHWHRDRWHKDHWHRGRHMTSSSTSDDFLDEVAVFGGSERVIHSESFRGGRLVAVFGGSKIDLTNVKMASVPNEVEIVVVFGGTELIVPSDWNVKIEVFNIFGGFSDKTAPSQVDLNKTMIIKGVAVFGGGEIKRK
jgi:predicted membrane protein